MTKITIHVEGMSCGHCELAVQEAVQKNPGVKKVKASKKKKEATIQFDETQTSPEKMVESIQAIGFTASL